MENNDKTQGIIIHEGIGDDAIEMTVQVTQEELDKMDHIRRFSPENWEGKDLELLQEARKLLNEKPADSSTQAPNAEQTTTIEKEESKRSNSGLWWTLGIIVALFIGYEAFMAYVKQQTKDIVKRSALNYTKKTISFNGVSFDYPGNWSFDKNNNTDQAFMIDGNNEIGSEYVVLVFNSSAIMPVEDCLDAAIEGCRDLNESGSDIEYSAIYDSQFDGMDVLAVDCKYKHNGKDCYGIVKAFEINGKSFTIIKSATNEVALTGEDFKMMENSFKYTKTN